MLTQKWIPFTAKARMFQNISLLYYYSIFLLFQKFHAKWIYLRGKPYYSEWYKFEWKKESKVYQFIFDDECIKSNHTVENDCTDIASLWLYIRLYFGIREFWHIWCAIQPKDVPFIALLYFKAQQFEVWFHSACTRM